MYSNISRQQRQAFLAAGSKGKWAHANLWHLPYD